MADLSYIFSGGLANTDPNLSLGGDPSGTLISDDVNNLYDDITGDEVTDGNVDYRCFYVANDTSDVYKNVKFWVDFEYPDGANVEVGMILQNETQSITFSGSPSGGTFRLTVDGLTTANIAFDANTTTLASNIQTAIRALANGQDTEVTVLASNQVQVEFTGENENHKYPLITINDNSVTPSSTITVTETQAGSPINRVTVDIGAETTPPTGITFSSPSEGSPFLVGKLKPTEVFFVWVKRTIQPEDKPVAIDGFRVKIRSDVLLS